MKLFRMLKVASQLEVPHKLPIVHEY